MAKQAKMKKGSIGKKALAAILAASMVLSSSAFSVLAAEVSLNEDNGIMTVAATEMPKDTGITVTLSLGGKSAKVEDESTGTESAQVLEAEWTGSPLIPTVEIKNASDTLTPNKDYSVTVDNNTDIGKKAHVHIDFISNGSEGEKNWGLLTKRDYYFTIKAVGIADKDPTYSVSSERSFVYNGTEQLPVVSDVKIKINGVERTLTASDYKRIAGSSKKPVDVDDYTLSLEGQGNYSGTVDTEVTFKITGAIMTNNNVKVEGGNVAYGTNKAGIEKLIKVTDLLSGKKIDVADTDSDDYDFEFYKGTEKLDDSDLVKLDVGTYTVRVVPSAAATGNFDRGYAEGQFTVGSDLQTAADNAKTVKGFIANSAQIDATRYDGSNKWSNIDASKTAEIELPGVDNDDIEVVTKDVDWREAGDYEIEIRGKHAREGQTAKIKVTILPRKINKTATWDGEVGTKASAVANDFDVKVESATTKSGKETEPQVKIVDDETNIPGKPKTLVENVDYSYTLDNNGETAVITGMGNYTTELTTGDKGTFTVNIKQNEKMPLDNKIITAVPNKTWTWEDGKTLTITETDFTVTENDTPAISLIAKTDYVINGYKQNGKDCKLSDLKAGTAYVTLKAPDEHEHYDGSVDVEITIAGEAKFADVFEANEVRDVAQKEGGSATFPTVADVKKLIVVKNKTTGAEYSSGNMNIAIFDSNGTDVSTTYASSQMPTGSYTIVITDKIGKYEGAIEIPLNVLGEDVSSNITVTLKADSYNYTGEEIKPEATVTGSATAGDIKSADYDVTYEDNINVGTAAVVVTLKGRFSGTKKIPFKINPVAGSVKLREAQENALANGMGVGDADCVPKLVGMIGSKEVNDTTLKVASMTSSDTSVAEITSEGAIKYVGKGTATVTITPASENLTGLQPFDVTVKVTSATPTKETPEAHLTAKHYSKAKKTIGFTTNTVKGATKWEAQYSLKNLATTTKGAKKAKYGKSNRLSHKTIKVNKTKKRYYIRVRAYVNGEWTAWSEVEKITSR